MHQDEHPNNAVPSGGCSPERGTANKRRRFSAKARAVLRPLRGESIETPREYRISTVTLSQWRDDFIYAGRLASGAVQAATELLR